MTDVGPSDANDAALLAAAAEGDEQAFATFYLRYLAAVTGFHLRRTGRREIAFDLTAETFAAAAQGWAGYFICEMYVRAYPQRRVRRHPHSSRPSCDARLVSSAGASRSQPTIAPKAAPSPRPTSPATSV
jgi:hypothetical protein